MKESTYADSAWLKARYAASVKAFWSARHKRPRDGLIRRHLRAGLKVVVDEI